ncbi:MAG: hypothetical protein ACHQXL_00215, partial [Candidatus Limnocylindrales bacterium]
MVESAAEPDVEPVDPPPPEPEVEPAAGQAVEPSTEPAAPLLGPGARAVAGVDVGANSVHLLVAVVTGHRLEPVV